MQRTKCLQWTKDFKKWENTRCNFARKIDLFRNVAEFGGKGER
jgi:hypothetical protein